MTPLSEGDEELGFAIAQTTRPLHAVEKQLSPKGSPLPSNELINKPTLGPLYVWASTSTGWTVSTSTPPAVKREKPWAVTLAPLSMSALLTAAISAYSNVVPDWSNMFPEK